MSLLAEALKLKTVVGVPLVGLTVKTAAGAELQIPVVEGVEKGEVLPAPSVAVAVTLDPLGVPLQEKSPVVAFAVVVPS